jgi:hypothetical protein
MFRRLLCLLILIVLTAAAMAQYGATSQAGSQPGVKLRGRSFSELYAAQKVLLSSYCRLEFEGARLQASGWNRLKPFTSLRSNPDFSRVVIVTRYDIEAPAQPTEQLYANYHVVGLYDESEGYSDHSTNDRVEFRVQEQNGNLLVTEVAPDTPHVSPRAAVAWMNLRLSDPKITELERAHLKDAVNQLNNFLPQPHPAATTAAPGA